MIGVDDFERDRTIERFIDGAIGDSHGAATQLPCTAIRMMLNVVSTQLIRDRSNCGVTLLCLSIQTGSNQTGNATQIAGGSCLHRRAAGFANTLALTYGRHCDLLMQPWRGASTAALHP